MSQLTQDQVNYFVAGKQHLLASQKEGSVLAVTRDLVGLHGTVPITPYLSLWARIRGFQRSDLETALHEGRSLVRYICNRRTLHLVAADELAYFYQAYSERHQRETDRGNAKVAVAAGLCDAFKAEAVLARLAEQVLARVAEGPATARQIAAAVPELGAQMTYAEGKPYAGRFSVGSGLIRALCGSGQLVRARPAGGWRSNSYEYSSLAKWLPQTDLAATDPLAARTWLVRRYLAAFGPATFRDLNWWTGLTKGDIRKALAELAAEVVEIDIAAAKVPHLLLAVDAERLRDFQTPDDPTVFLLPGLDPYIMGYQDRRRFLPAEHQAKVFDRSGNAVATIWVDGRVAGVWGQRPDASVVVGLFESSPAAKDRIASAAHDLEQFFAGEHVPPRYRTPYERSLSPAPPGAISC